MAVALNSGEDSISLIDTQSYTEISRIPIGKEPHHLMATPDDRYLIVANSAGNDLVFLDPVSGQIQRRLPHISDPYQPFACRAGRTTWSCAKTGASCGSRRAGSKR